MRHIPSAAATAALVHLKSLQLSPGDYDYLSEDLVTFASLQRRSQELFEYLPSALHKRIRIVSHTGEDMWRKHTSSYLITSQGRERELLVVANLQPAKDDRTGNHVDSVLINVSLDGVEKVKTVFRHYPGNDGYNGGWSRHRHGELRMFMLEEVAKKLLGLIMPSNKLDITELARKEFEQMLAKSTELDEVYRMRMIGTGEDMQAEMEVWVLMRAFLGDELLGTEIGILERHGRFRYEVHCALMRDFGPGTEYN